MALHGHGTVSVPYTSRLVEKIQSGQSLVLRGTVADNPERFEINLLSGCQEINPHAGNCAFHFNARFDEKKLVLNTLVSAEWGKEERHSNPFKAGTPFDLRIRVHDDKFEIWCDQKHIADYKHRISSDTIDHLQVLGDVSLNSVDWGGRYFKTPFTTAFHDRTLRTGQRVCVYGIPKGDFEVNFVDDNGDSLFHFKPKFSEKTVVRGAQTNGEWGEEEREGDFPFKKGTAFDLVIENEPYSIQIFVNDKRFGTFAHRVSDPNSAYRTLSVAGDVDVTSVEVNQKISFP